MRDHHLARGLADLIHRSLNKPERSETYAGLVGIGLFFDRWLPRLPEKFILPVIGISFLAPLLVGCFDNNQAQVIDPDRPAIIDGMRVDPAVAGQVHIVYDNDGKLKAACQPDTAKITVRLSKYPLSRAYPNAYGLTRPERDGSISILILDMQGIDRLFKLPYDNELPSAWRTMPKDQLKSSLQKLAVLHEFWHACGLESAPVSKDQLQAMGFKGVFLKDDYQFISQGFLLVQKKPSESLNSDNNIYYSQLEEIVTYYLTLKQASLDPELNDLVQTMEFPYRYHEVFLNYLDDGTLFDRLVELKKAGDIYGLWQEIKSRVSSKLNQENAASSEIASAFITSGIFNDAGYLVNTLSKNGFDYYPYGGNDLRIKR